MELLQRRIPKTFSLPQDLLIRLETEVAGKSTSRWVEEVIRERLDKMAAEESESQKR